MSGGYSGEVLTERYKCTDSLECVKCLCMCVHVCVCVCLCVLQARSHKQSRKI